jgi:hypothetical protein
MKKLHLLRWLNALDQLRSHYQPGATLEDMTADLRKQISEVKEQRRLARAEIRRRWPTSIGKQLDRLGAWERNSWGRGKFYAWLRDQGLLFMQDVGAEHPVRSPTEKALRLGYAKGFSATQDEWTEDGLRKLVALYKQQG